MKKLLVYVNDSIPDYKIKEEIDFIKFLIEQQSYWIDFDCRVKGLFASARIRSLEKDNIFIIPTDYLDKSVSYLKKENNPGLVLVEVRKTNLVDMYKNINNNNTIVATNNYRYEGYKDFLGKNFISVENVTPEHLMRKALLRTLNYIRDVPIREKVIKQYLLGSN